MIVKYDYFNRLEAPILTLCNPNDSPIAQIANYQELNLDLCFNDQSVITFKVYKYIKSGKKNKVYDKLQAKREILVSGIKTDTTNSANVDLGYFDITEVSEHKNEDNKIYKEITAYSCEYELIKKELHYIDGVYKLYDGNSTECLLAKIFSGVSRWRVVHVDTSIATLYRTFEFGKNTIYNFLISELAEAYGAIVQFDILNRTISFYDRNTYIDSQNKRTHIVISKRDIIKSIKRTQNEDDLFTCLYVTGDNGLDISSVNPLGGNNIINVDYFANSNWMSSDLLTSLNKWKTKLTSYEMGTTQNVQVYYELSNIPLDKKNANDFYIITHNSESVVGGKPIVNIAYTDCDVYKYDGTNFNKLSYTLIDKFQVILLLLDYENEKLISIENALSTSRTTLKGLNDEKSAVISSSETDMVKNEHLTTINTNIKNYETQITQLTTTSTNKNSVIKSIQNRVANINSDLSLSSNFTTSEYSELSAFISEGSHEDQNITITDSMTFAEKQKQALSLYNKSKELLCNISKPSEEFDVETDGGLFHKKFIKFVEEIDTGCVISIADEDEEIEERILHKIAINYDDKKICLTFGNRFRPQTPRDSFQDLYSEATKTANSVNYINKTFDFTGSKDIISDFDTFRKRSLDLTKQDIISSSNQDFMITRNGILGRKLLPSGSGFENEQMMMTNNTIAYSTDAFQSIRTAFGKINVGGTNYYGVNGEAIVGKFILSEKAFIGDSTGNVQISKDGIEINNGKFLLKDGNGNNSIYMDATGNVNLNTINIASGGTVSGKLSSKDGSCYFDFDNNLLLANKLGFSDSYAQIGSVNGFAGMGLYYQGSKYISFEAIQGGNFCVRDSANIGRIWIQNDLISLNDRNKVGRFYADNSCTTITDPSGKDRFSSNSFETVLWIDDNNYFTLRAGSAYLVRNGTVVWSA